MHEYMQMQERDLMNEKSLLMEMELNYKQLDTRKIIDYINSFSESVAVEEILRHSGADKLRVYPALFELEQSGFLEVVEREELGAPSIVRRRRDSSLRSE